MAEENTSTPEGISDEQISQQFPGQDVTHIRAMMDKMAGKGAAVSPPADGEPDGSTATAPETPEYPSWIPEKFRQGSVEDAMQKLAESYSVLEGARGPAAADGADADTGGTDAGADGADAAPAAFDVNVAEAEFTKDGKVSEATYAAAEKAGMPRATLDAYIAGQQAIANQLLTKAHDEVGGPDQYETMLRWAVNNWAESAVDAYDAAMSSGNEQTILLAIKGLKASYAEANGNPPARRLDGENNPALVSGFQSKAEMTAAMKDPRYRKDPAYRKEVEQRIAQGKVW